MGNFTANHGTFFFLPKMRSEKGFMYDIQDTTLVTHDCQELNLRTLYIIHDTFFLDLIVGV